MTASRTSRLVGVLLAGATAAAMISACSAGQVAQTATQVAAVPGASADIGPNAEIALRDLVVAYNDVSGYPQGGSAPLVVRIFNRGQTAVVLTGVSAGDAAAGVELVGGTPEATAGAPEPTSEPAPTAEPSPGTEPSPGAEASPGAEPSPAEPSPTAAGQATFRVEIPAGSYVMLVPQQGPYLQLTGLTDALTPGESVPLTFTFEGLEPAEIRVPFGIPLTPAPRATPEVDTGHQ